uniref:G-protein coupled receptors family 1 profile domain-containing protein n=1 Tax=Panagrolaimus sp. ES5 TaxID=591445 RepID=A0AC34G440_9BILA
MLDISNILKIILYTFALILSLTIAVSVLYAKLYHGNLRFMLTNVSITHSILLTLATAAEFFTIFELQWKGKDIVYKITDLCIWATIFNMLCLFCERSIASLLDKKYETMCIGMPWLGILLALIDWTCAGIFAMLPVLKLVHPITLAYIIISLDIIALFMFSFMPSLTYKRYMFAATNANEFSLSQRYQMSENYRSAKVLTRIVWCCGVTSILSSTFYILKGKFPEHSGLFNTFYIISLTSPTIIYPILMMCYEIKVRDVVICNKSQRDFVAKTIAGKNLVISNSEEQCEAYFNGYKQAWA